MIPLLVAACAPAHVAIPPAEVKGRHNAMGSAYAITVMAPAGREAAAQAAIDAAFAEIDRLDALLTTWRPSPLTRVNDAAGGAAVAVPPELVALTRRTVAWCLRTERTMDPTYLPIGRLWDWRQEPFAPPTDAQIEAARALVDCGRVEIDEAASTLRLPVPGMALDFGAVGQGYAVDRAAAVLRAAGFADALLDGSGDMLGIGRHGDRAWRVGVQNPRAPRGATLGHVALIDRAFTTSGDYERFTMVDGERVHHVVDPRTGRPSRGTASASVAAADAETADALDTALLVLGPDGAKRVLAALPQVEAFLVLADGDTWATPGLAAEIYSSAADAAAGAR